MPSSNRISSLFLLTGLLPLLAAPVWLAAGTIAELQGTFVPLSIWAWLCWFAAPGSARFPARRERIYTLLRDPALWCVILFWLFLGIQAWNSDRIRIPDIDLGFYTYSSPRVSWLPSSVLREDGLEMLRWFVPVLSLLIICKHTGSLLFKDSYFITGAVLLNALLNAGLAFLHQFHKWEKMYHSLWNTGKDTYGSFGYPNHAATFFILMFGLALGCLLFEVFRDHSQRSFYSFLFSLVCTLAFFFAAQFSASRAGMLGTWLVLAISGGIVGWIAWPRLHPVHRLYGTFALAALIIALIGGFRFFAQPVHFREFRQATADLDPGREFSARFFQVRSAWDMWKDHPFFGVGGWGYKYFVGFYLDESEWTFLGVGKANVHHDFFQFLAEFGLVGMFFLVGAFASVLKRIFLGLFLAPTHDNSIWGDPVRIGCAASLLLMIAHSFIDLPFRSPAVFAHGVFVLMVLYHRLGEEALWPPVVDMDKLRPLPLNIEGFETKTKN